MKLLNAPNSPFGRKVMACAIAREIDTQIEQLAFNPYTAPADLVAANPLGKIPCLITPDGKPIFDSPVICEFLDSLGDAAPMFPAGGGARWRALRQQAIGDGMLDAAILRRQESARPLDPARAEVMARQKAAVDRALDALEQDTPHRTLDIGVIAIACALGYLDFRFPHEPWRPAHPSLAQWFDAIASAPPLARTAPADAA